MPVVESAEVIHRETRLEALVGIQRLVGKFREQILAVRLGATDLSSAYALRRNRDLTVYDVRVVADAIGDVVNVFARADETGLLVTGPVWEHYPDTERLFKPLLRESPFIAHEERALRAQLITADLDGLIREIVLDKANGLTGKTAIHPTHVPAAHALYVVTHEEYSDAMDVVHGAAAAGGAHASSYRNKMNEGSPHRPWAQRTLLRADVFGVAREGVSFVDLLGASVR
jgi:citrate lyase beta subunit